MTGVQFVTDNKGRKVAVLIDLKKHGARLQDFWDGMISESRRKETGIPLEKVKADLVKRGGFVDSYAVELKPSARKELESLPDTVLARMIRKLESLTDDPRPAGCKKLRVIKTSGASALATGALYTSLTIQPSS
jgi:hypothetical protein